MRLVGVDLHDAEGRGFHPGNLDAPDGDVRARFHVLGKHQPVIHLVDVVSGEDHDVLGRVAFDDVDVLGHRIRGPEIPLVLGDPL